MVWIIGILAVVFVLLFLFACLCMYVSFGKRCEGNPHLKYFTADDFDGLEAEPVEFMSDKGQILRGYIYTRNEISDPIGLVVFAHGMGGGHLSYTTEINTFAASGFKVLAYDNTGTMASDGEKLGSFYQSARDLQYALKFVQSNKKLSKYKIVLAGHSWGGYAVCQTVTKENVSGAVVLSAPNSTAKVIGDGAKAMAGFSLSWLRPFLYLASIVFGGWSARNTCAAILMKTKDVPILLLQGDKDTSVVMKNSPVYYDKIRNKENITAIIYNGKAHNVYQTRQSEEYLAKRFSAINAAKIKYGKAEIPEDEKERLYAIDYKLITQEDPEVMKTITDFMKDCVK